MVMKRARLGPAIGLALGLASLLAVASSRSASTAATADAVTWSKDIAPLFQRHCQGCHRPGEIGPFSLVDYPDAYRERRKILRAVERRKMPPWKPVPGFGEF